MVRLSPMSAKKLIKILKRLGFEEIRQKGSHKFFINRTTGLVTTIPDHGAKDLPVGLIHDILKDLEMSLDEFDTLR